MNIDYNLISLIVLGVAVVVIGVAYFISKIKSKNKNTEIATSQNNTKGAKNSEQSAFKKNPDASLPKEDVFNFMEFDKIQDDMIIQQNGEKYTAVIKCKGINYNLMSEVEQLAVEEGFITFLNTLKCPVQLYVQAQMFDLDNNIAEYKENMNPIYQEYDDINSKYSMLINSLETTDEEIEQVEDERNSILNVLEYGKDIVRYVEKLALNKNMLQRSFYVLVSYHKAELSNASQFSKEEMLDICYSELFTRAQNIISGLSMCSVSANILKSNEVADLLYSAYNRDDQNYVNVQQALDSGFYRLYSTSEDAITKKQQKLVESIKQEAEYKAIAALNKAIEEGTLSTQADAEDAYDQESSKQAIDIITKEKVPENIKKEAKKIIVEEYKKAKKDRIEKQEKNIAKLKEQIATIKGENLEEAAEDTQNEQEENNTEVDENTGIV